MYDVIILGSGPAGLTAALYAARANKKTIVLGGDRLGGQMAGIATLENYPGWAGSGSELAEFMKNQAETFGATVEFVSATNVVKNENNEFIVTANNKEYIGKTVIVATGASPRKLEIAGARELMGRGVSYCATCDGFFYSGKTVIVMGGGNSALNDALYLADLAKTVKIVYRKSEFFRAEAVLRDRVAQRDNIECLFNTDLAKIEEKTDSPDGELIVTTTSGEQLVVDGVFVVDNAPWLAKILDVVNPDDYESLQYFQRTLQQSGIIDALVKLGVQDGDIVSVYNIEFEFVS